LFGGRSTFKVDGPLASNGMRVTSHRIELTSSFVELELFLDGVDDRLTDVNRKADRFWLSSR